MEVSTSIIAMQMAILLAVGFVGIIGLSSLLLGFFNRYVDKAKLDFLKPIEKNSFGFILNWNAAREPMIVDYLKLNLFNPNGTPTRLEIYKSFKGFAEPTPCEISLGSEFLTFLAAKGFEKSLVEIELGSSKEGINFKFDYSGQSFKKLWQSTSKSVADYLKMSVTVQSNIPYDVPVKSFISEPQNNVVESVNADLVIAVNPAFQALFSGGGGTSGGAAGAGAALVNFAVSKVWIEPGCIVCNACEDIYPEVFDVQADTCIVKPNPPLTDGLKIQEAAEGCPVEVIKFTKINA